MQKLVDLSYPIEHGMPCYPSDPGVSLKTVKTIQKNGAEVTDMSMGSHTGTHVDAPSHILENGRRLSDMKLSSFAGLAVKLHIDRYEEFDWAGFNFDGLILETGWGAFFGDPARYFGPDRPEVPFSLAKTATEAGISFFGCDLPSVDKSGIRDKIIHKTFLSRQIPIFENLANLARLPEGNPFMFFGFPLNMKGMDGSPVRAVAMPKHIME